MRRLHPLLLAPLVSACLETGAPPAAVAFEIEVDTSGRPCLYDPQKGRDAFEMPPECDGWGSKPDIEEACRKLYFEDQRWEKAFPLCECPEGFTFAGWAEHNKRIVCVGR